MKINIFLSLLAITFGGGFLSSTAMTPENTIWYYNLIKPVPFIPPAYLFSIAWSIFFILLSLSAFIVWDKAKKLFFALHLIGIFTWPFLFFALQNIIFGIIGTLFILLTLIFCIKDFKKVNIYASYLLYPEFAWVIFALYMNISILFFNH